MVVVLGYYLLNLTLGSILPAREVNGTKLAHHDRPLKYRLNGKVLSYHATVTVLTDLCSILNKSGLSGYLRHWNIHAWR